MNNKKTTDTTVDSSKKTDKVTPPPSINSKSKKKKFIVLATAGAFLFVVASSVAGYFLWYNAPNKMLADGVVGLVDTTGMKGDVNIDDGAKKMQLGIDLSGNKDAVKVRTSVNFSQGENNFAADVDIIAKTDGVTYVKVDNIDKIMKTFVDTTSESAIKNIQASGNTASPEMIAMIKAQIESMVEPVEKIKGKWIVIKPEDLEDLTASKITASKNGSSCINDAIQKIRSNNQTKDSFIKLFRKHQFILVDESVSVEDRGNLKGLKVRVDRDIAKQFSDAAKELPAVKEVADCTSQYDGENQEDVSDSDAGNNTDSNSNSELTVWVDKMSHRIIELEGSSALDKKNSSVADESVNSAESATTKANIKAKLSYDNESQINLPSDNETVSVDELKIIFTGLMSGAVDS